MGVSQTCCSSVTNSAAAKPLSARRFSCRVKPSSRGDHVQGGRPTGVTVRLSQVAPHDEPIPVLYLRAIHEVKYRPAARGFPEEARVKFGGRGRDPTRVIEPETHEPA